MKKYVWKVAVVVVLIAAAGVALGSKPKPKSTVKKKNTTCTCATSKTKPGAVCACKSKTAPATNKKPAIAKNVSAPTKPAPAAKLVDLGSKSCIPCKQMAPILDELKKQDPANLSVVFYDVYEQRDLAQPYKVRVIPTQVFFDRDGKEFFRHEGFMPKADILAKFKEKGVIPESPKKN